MSLVLEIVVRCIQQIYVIDTEVVVWYIAYKQKYIANFSEQIQNYVPALFVSIYQI